MGAGRAPVFDAEIRHDIGSFMSNKLIGTNEPIVYIGHSRGYAVSIQTLLHYISNGGDPDKIHLVGLSGFAGANSLSPAVRAILESILAVNIIQETDIIPEIGPHVGSTVRIKVGDEKWVWIPYDEETGTPGHFGFVERKFIDIPYPHYIQSAFFDIIDGKKYYEFGEQSVIQSLAYNFTNRLINRNPPYLQRLLEQLFKTQSPELVKMLEEYEATVKKIGQ